MHLVYRHSTLDEILYARYLSSFQALSGNRLGRNPCRSWEACGRIQGEYKWECRMGNWMHYIMQLIAYVHLVGYGSNDFTE